MQVGVRCASIGSETPIGSRSWGVHGPAQTMTVPAAISPSLVTTPCTRPPPLRMAVTSAPTTTVAPSRCAAAARVTVVNDGSAYPLPGS